jgi:hypothetical protein
MASVFSQSEVSPVIARLLLAEGKADPSAFILHKRIVELILADPQGATLIAQALAKGSKIESDHTMAATMIAWFSAQMTRGVSEWAGFFEKKRLKKSYPYSFRTAILHREDDQDMSAIEGNPKIYPHLVRERKQSLVKAKRDWALKANGVIACEVCDVVIADRYSGVSVDVCEVHHVLPLSDSEGPVLTKLEDLALVCPTCHRVIHRTQPMLSIKALRAKLQPVVPE